MPNANNIYNPITLIAYGRSGTSLVARSIARNTDVELVGETANLIFTPYRSVEQITGLTRMLDESSTEVGAEISRFAFLKAFPSDKPEWIHKPIGIPRIFWEFGYHNAEHFISWYWMVLSNIFPNSRNFSIVRHPFDVFLSARDYWDFDDAAIWQTLTLMMRLLHYGVNNFRIVVKYEDLVREPENTMRSICGAVELPFSENMLKDFDVLHAQRTDHKGFSTEHIEEKKASQFSRQTDWEIISGTPEASAALRAYEALIESI
jgi:hypothetical protein